MKVFRGKVAGITYDDIGHVDAICGNDLGPEECLKELKNQTCKLGGDIVYDLPDEPLKPSPDKISYTGRVAHTRAAGSAETGKAKMRGSPMRSAWLGLVVLFALSGCATFRGVNPGSKDKWYVITTTHFVVYTDLDQRAAGKAAAELEATRDALIAAISPGATLGNMVRTRVFVLADAQEFKGIFGPDVTGLFAPGAPGAFYVHAPIDIGPSTADSHSNAPPSVLRHAMTHHLIAAALPRAPPWLDEGLAQLLETAQLSSDRRSVVLGHLNSKARARFAANSTVTLRRLLEWKEPIGLLPEREGLGLYGTSYVFVHWLYNQHAEALAGYLRALAGGSDPARSVGRRVSGIRSRCDGADPRQLRAR